MVTPVIRGLFARSSQISLESRAVAAAEIRDLFDAIDSPIPKGCNALGYSYWDVEAYLTGRPNRFACRLIRIIDLEPGATVEVEDSNGKMFVVPVSHCRPSKYYFLSYQQGFVGLSELFRFLFPTDDAVKEILGNDLFQLQTTPKRSRRPADRFTPHDSFSGRQHEQNATQKRPRPSLEPL
eukprot:CAMPEP_0197390886 /NCGR_PEP_ID=MMETSP1165-20131217/2715_1 /TAXON_ID=284809 /ORGANISM="Chrysocystis fragilis, Strain CCMP3189" /LENGTH=180 /DNA_ID=CAMNT_0042916411 /DNA_START=134 /DNA_END=676 /DNA_ORIENTATION=+